MSLPKIRILFVDDEEHNLISFKASFRTKYAIETALSGQDAIEMLKEKQFDIIITDQRMPKMTGVEFLEQIIPIYPEPIRILLTGYTDMAAVIDAINKGKIFHYLNKPWNETELDDTIQKAYLAYLEKKRMQEENEQLSVTNEQLEFLLRQKLLS
ncbi:response regulator [Parapedobacter lycopersici]|uniref:response regulator n=1 Tax=Parapedobacter lycopersici TaxID=1864939 RepID=UPI00214D2500|nr:response regulator [Parapedobacter lycopersici]